MLTVGPLSPSNLTVPPTPPGFTAAVYLGTSKPLNPLAVHVVAIGSMYVFAQEPWDFEVDGATAFEPGYNVIIVSNNQQPAGAPLRLKTSHVILGLYEGLMTMLGHNRFCELSVTLSIHQRQVGELSMRAEHVPIEAAADSTIIGTSLDAISPVITATDDSNALQRQYTDPSDPKFKMIYQFHGSRIPSKNIFTAALNGLANAAVFDPKSPCDRLKAVSENSGCLIQISKLDGQSMDYAQATKALKWMTSTIPILEKTFGEMNAQLVYDGQRIADGYILKATTPNDSIKNVVVS